MTASTHHDPGTRTLLRVLTAYLCFILMLQGVAAAAALGAGPLHRHREPGPGVTALVFSHHGHAHASGERHHHDAADSSVQHEASVQDAVDAAASALTLALSLLALDSPRMASDARRHVLHATPPWAWLTASVQQLLRPPRQG